MKTFKSELSRLIDSNIDDSVRFVVHPHSKEETDSLFEIFKQYNIIAPVPGLTLEKYREHAEEEFGKDVCYEINLSSMITLTNNIEHWKQYTKDIIEWDGEKEQFNFIEGCE